MNELAIAHRGSMNAPHKIVGRSKILEWRGLDRTALVVHGMRCIWREQEKDDIGIDGEIELCRPRDDGGEGLIGTGKIVKVQSKAGSSYVIHDEEDSFVSPVMEKDLRYWRDLNVPVIYIVYHPAEGTLYWKDIKAYLAANPDAFTPPLRIEFDKAADRFAEKAYPALCALCEQAPERVALGLQETLYTNLLPVLELPSRVFVTPVVPEKQPRFHSRLTGSGVIPPYAFNGRAVATLRDPTEPGTALTNVVEPSVDPLDLDEFLSQGEQAEHDLKALLNGVIHRRLRRIGLTFQKGPRRYF